MAKPRTPKVLSDLYRNDLIPFLTDEEMFYPIEEDIWNAAKDLLDSDRLSEVLLHVQALSFQENHLAHDLQDSKERFEENWAKLKRMLAARERPGPPPGGLDEAEFKQELRETISEFEDAPDYIKERERAHDATFSALVTLRRAVYEHAAEGRLEEYAARVDRRVGGLLGPTGHRARASFAYLDALERLRDEYLERGQTEDELVFKYSRPGKKEKDFFKAILRHHPDRKGVQPATVGRAFRRAKVKGQPLWDTALEIGERIRRLLAFLRLREINQAPLGDGGGADDDEA